MRCFICFANPLCLDHGSRHLPYYRIIKTLLANKNGNTSSTAKAVPLPLEGKALTKGVPMKKIYFKKLKRGIGYALIMYLIYGVGADILVTLSNFFKEYPFVQLLITVGIPATILFCVASYYRINDSEKFKAYNRAVPYDELKIKDDLLYTLKSPDLHGDILVALTLIGVYLVPSIAIPIIRVGGARAIFVALLSTFVTLLVAMLFYTAADIISWTVTHKHYLLDRDIVVMDEDMVNKDK